MKIRIVQLAPLLIVSACGWVGRSWWSELSDGGRDAAASPVLDAAAEPLDASVIDAPFDTTMQDAAQSDPDAAATDDLDATEPIAFDAAPSDARSPLPTDAGPEAGTCAGTVILNLCWYLGPVAQSCNSACLPHGGFDPRSIRLIGISSQGGTFAACADVMDGLGQLKPIYGYRTDGNSVGCHMFTSNSSSWWLNDPTVPFTATMKYGGVRIACACLR